MFETDRDVARAIRDGKTWLNRKKQQDAMAQLLSGLVTKDQTIRKLQDKVAALNQLLLTHESELEDAHERIESLETDLDDADERIEQMRQVVEVGDEALGDAMRAANERHAKTVGLVQMLADGPVDEEFQEEFLREPGDVHEVPALSAEGDVLVYSDVETSFTEDAGVESTFEAWLRRAA